VQKPIAPTASIAGWISSDIWSRLGAQVVDFPYVQPPLSAEQQPDHGLIYAAVDYPGRVISAGLLHDHLESFFAISVGKGELGLPGDTASRQLADLAVRTAPVPLLEMAPSVARLREPPPVYCASFRELAREVAGQ
jgi:hypothetical protein